MFGKKAQPPIKSLIAAGTRIDGNMKFDEGLRVDGEVFGDILATTESGTSMLVISEAAVVQGAIQADHVIINGTVHGPVHGRRARAKMVANVGCTCVVCALIGMGRLSAAKTMRQPTRRTAPGRMTVLRRRSPQRAGERAGAQRGADADRVTHRRGRVRRALTRLPLDGASPGSSQLMLPEARVQYR